MIYILLSSEKTLYQVTTQYRSRKGAVEVVSATLDSKVKRNLPALQKKEQLSYLLTASEAAYSSLNKLDLKQAFHALVSLQSVTGNDISFETNSSSAGLGYALSLALEWREQLGKDNSYPYEVFATGEIHASGNVTAIGHVVTKVKSACNFIQKQHEETGNKNTPFLIFIPKANEQEISDALKKEVTELGGELVPVNRLQNALTKLLGDVYDGDPEGRWSPFKGLQSFDVEDSPRFFGREKAVNQLLESYQDIEGKLLVVTGVSGSGKSSTIKAGLFPAIRKQLVEGQHLHWKITSPKLHESLPDLLTTLFSIVTEHWDIDKTDRELAELSLNDPEALYQQLNLAQENKENESEQLLIFIDQYEELLNHSIIPRETAQKLAPLLEQLAKQTGLSIMLSIRAEYLESMGRYGVDTHVSQNLYPNEWKAIVEDQAAYSGLSYEQGLAERIINDANDIQHALPIVEYLLEQLYIKAIADDENSRELKHIHYEELGGINSLISTKAESVINQHPEIADAFFDYFVGLNTEGLPFARSVEINAIEKNSPALYQLIQAFIDSQLVIDCSSQSIHQVKLAHDSLLIQWDRLSAWLEDHKDYLIFRQQIDGQFVQWKKCNNNSQKQAKHYLLKNKGLLKQAKQQLKQGQFVQTELTNYLQQSIQSKRNGIISFITLFIIIPSLIGGGYWWDKTRITSKYYAFYATQWEIPVGVTELTEEQRSHKQYHYQIDTQDGKVIELSHRNSSGKLALDDNNFNKDSKIAKWKYIYKTNGNLSFIYGFNIHGVKKYNSSIEINKINKLSYTNFMEVFMIDANGDEYYNFDKYKNTYSSNGYKVEEISVSNINVEIYNDNGLIGYYFKYNEKGLLNNIMSIGIEGNKLGHNKKCIRNSIGYLSKCIYFDVNGNKAKDNTGVYGALYMYNNLGNLVNTSYINENNDAAVNISGINKTTYDYDIKGNLIKIRLFDLNNNPTEDEQGFHEFEFAYSDNGYISKECVYDKKNEKTKDNEGTHCKMNNYDENGNKIITNNIGEDNNLILDTHGVSTYKYHYNKQGLMEKGSMFGINGERVLGNTGYSIFRSHYDKSGNRDISYFYGIDEKPTLNNYGFHISKRNYNKKWLVDKESYFGIDEKPTLNNDRFHIMKKIYNKNGGLDKESYFGVDEKPTLNNNGFHILKFSYDPEGNINEKSYFGIGEKPLLVGSGYHIIKDTYDNGNITEQSYFGVNQKPTLNNDGIHTSKYHYDKKGNEIERYHFDIDKNRLFF